MAIETLVTIMKNVISSEGHMTIGYDHFGTNETGIERGSLNILRVSKFFSAIALGVLYSYRHYELAIETDFHRRNLKHDLESFSRYKMVRKPVIVLYVYHQLSVLQYHRVSLRFSENHEYNMRFQSLLNATDNQSPITTPTGCLDLLLRHTPASLYWTHLKIKINHLVAADLRRGQLVCALQHAWGLNLLEVELLVDVPDIMWFVRQLVHIQTIKLLSGKAEVFEKEMATRNGNWKETLQQGKRVHRWY